MWLIFANVVSVLALLIGIGSLYGLLKHSFNCSKVKLRRAVEKEIEELDQWQRNAELSMEAAHDKLMSIVGRADRAKRKSKQESELPLDYGQAMDKAQIIQTARNRGIIR